MDTNEKSASAQVLVIDGQEYVIDKDTANKLKAGEIPPALQAEITARQGDDIRFEFCRQRRLMKKICDKIDVGLLPESIRTLVESGAVPPEILYRLDKGKLLGKAEQLHAKHFLSSEVLETIRRDVLTAEIIKPLEQAIFADTAMYLWEHHEITGDILSDVLQGGIDIRYIKVIRRYSRQILNASEVERRHLLSIPDLNYENLESLNHLEDCFDIGSGLVQEMYRRYLEEALSWLPSGDARLIEAIYFDCIPMTKIAEMYGVTEGTIRYHRNRIIARLKIILEDVMHLSRDILF